MAEVISAIVQQIVTIAAEEAKQKVKLVIGVEDEVHRMKRHLLAIDAVLEDAEEKQMTDRGIKLWLDWLEEVAREIEDVLDEWSTALLKLKINRSEGQRPTSSSKLKGKVCSFVKSSCCFHSAQGSTPQIARRYDIASKIKTISGKLDEIAREKEMYGLNVVNPAKHMPRRVESSSFDVDVSKIYGRDKMKEGIIDCLLSGGTGEQIETISLVGMGGVGKTALAQLVYHDSRVEQHFEKRMWVCVSDVFEEKNVAKAIIIALEGLDHNKVYTFDLIPMEDLLKRICTCINGLKFFLVLDDVWADNRQEWERLLRTFKRGAPGSRILLTTRKDTVGNMLDYSRVFHLDRLSDDDCWIVLSQLAFFGRNEEERRGLKDVGRKISDRCKGLPLAAKTLGSLLRFKSSRAEWESISNSELWKVDNAQRDIFAPLLLSYYDLPTPVRLCFKYCAIFPKDYLYWRHHVIYHWMAQGYLGPSDSAGDDQDDVKLKGREYLNLLRARSLFQDFTTGPGGLVWTWKMHDIVHDFARFLMRKNESVISEINSGNNAVIDLSVSKPRYLTAHIAENNCLPTSIYGAEELRSLVIVSTGNAVSSEALQVIFNRAKRLRVLDFGHSLKGTIPQDIGNMVHLRHINLNTSTRLQRLPESVCGLCNLQYLDLNFCTSLEELPDGIGKLINLIFLRIVYCPIRRYPKSIGRLTNLRQLRGVKLRVDRNDPEELSLGDLKDLNRLIDLFVENLRGNAIDVAEVSRANFENKTQLDMVRVYWTGTLSEEGVSETFNLRAGVLIFGSE